MEKNVRNEKLIRFSMVMAFVAGLVISGMAQAPGSRTEMNRDLKFSGLCGNGSAYGKGYEISWNGIPAPASYSASEGGTYMICITVNLSHNPMIKGETPEFLKYLHIQAGSCWTGFRNFTPSADNGGFMTGDLGNGTGTWTATEKNGAISWEFRHPENGNPSGDGDYLPSGYRCVQYSFCFTADINPACTDLNGLNIEATLEGDGRDKGIKHYNSGLQMKSTLINNSAAGNGPSITSIQPEAVKNGLVSLSWNYQNGFAPGEFIIEHSADGAAFTEAFRVNSTDASLDEQHYQILFKEELSGRIFYRVRVAEKTQGQIISPTAEIHLKSENSFTLQYLKPNPASDYAEVAFTSPESAFAEIQVQDMNGRIVHSESVYAQTGINTIEFKMESWRSGLYYIFIQKGSETLTAKLVKQ